ncbi:hypothetical protein [Aeromonas phage 59.1]|nr:hypothetical protein [Aeromonas phage 59.1]
MALDGDRLGGFIVAQLQAKGFVPVGEHQVSKPFWDAIGRAIVQEIKASAEVKVTAGSSAGTYKVT